MSTGQKVVIGVVASLVVALFAFMIANSGPDRERERQIAAGETSDDDTGSDAEDLVAAATSAPLSTEAPTTAPSPAANDPVDLDAFCRGGFAVIPIETRLYAAWLDEDWAELSSLVRERRGEWVDAVNTLSTGAPALSVDDIVRYRDVTVGYFDAVDQSSGFADMVGKVDSIEVMRASSSVEEVFALVRHFCE